MDKVNIIKFISLLYIILTLSLIIIIIDNIYLWFLFFIPFFFILLIFIFPIFIDKILILINNFEFYMVVYLIIIISSLTWFITDPYGESGILNISQFIRIITILVIIYYVLIYFLKNKSITILVKRNFVLNFLFIFGFIAFYSAIISIYPLLGFYKAMELIADIIIGVFIFYSVLKSDSIKNYWDFTLSINFLFLLIVIFEAIIMPSKAFFHDIGFLGIQLKGVYPIQNPNGIGTSAGILCLISLSRIMIWKELKNRLFYLSIFILCFLLLVVSQTRSALVGFIIGLMFLFTLSGNKSSNIIYLLIIMSVAYILGDTLILYFKRGQTDTLFYSLSGRMIFWDEALEYLKLSPWFGYGFGVGPRYVVLKSTGFIEASTLHNMFLEILLGCGFIGAFFLFTVYFVNLKRLFQLNMKDLDLNFKIVILEMFLVSIFSFIRLFFSSGFASHPGMLGFTINTLIIDYAYKRYILRRNI